MAHISNNPFIDHTASVASRYPDLNAVSPPPAPSSPQYSAGWQQQQQYSGFVGPNPTGYTQQYAQQPQQQQQQQYYPQAQQASYPSASYQPSFGQQLGQVDTLTTGYPQQQHMQAQYTGYPTQQSEYGYQQPQQQQQQQPGYGYPQQQQQQLLAQFDPYANLGQLSPTSRASAAPTTSGVVGSPPPGVQHPRTFIHSHKAELEAWDPPTWRQVQNTFESLKMAWEMRKRAAESQVRAYGGVPGAPPTGAGAGTGFFGGVGGYGGYGGGYQTPQTQEVDRLNAVRHL